MRHVAVAYGNVGEQVAAQMTRSQALRLRTLAHEAYQPAMFEKALTTVEADRRIAALKNEIELANSF